MNRLVFVSTARFCLTGLLALAPVLYGQKPVAPASSGTGTSGNTGNNGNLGTTTTNGSRGTFGNNPSTNRNTNNGGFDQQRPIFLAGTVMFDDGSPVNSDIRIERTCNGSSHLEAHTDSKGRFSFQVGGQMGVGIGDADVSSDGFGSTRNGMSGLGQSTAGYPGGSGSSNSNRMMGCELRAAYPGYISETVDLSTRHSMDDPKVGTILLHRLVNVKGSTISVVSAQAPKAAQKSYDKAMQLAQKGKFEEAIERFNSATAEYPKYAVAWYDLGRVQQKLNKLDDAKSSFSAAAAADAHYVSPLDQLALLSAQQAKWEDAVKYSKQATDLNPVEFPSSFWYNALANYNLKNNAEAEKAARALVKVDSRHRYPEAETMLAEFAVSRGDLDEGAAHLRAFLTLMPNAKNGDAIKHELERVEQARATQAKAAPTSVVQ